MSRAKILLIYTGGTIGMKNDPATGTLVPFDFNAIYDEFPYLNMVDADVEVLALDPIDSSNVTPGLWCRLAEIVRDNYGRVDGFVVLHGTDTMSYTSSALSFMLEGLAKPVVFTGSQIPIGILRTDGRENLITAIEIAAARRGDGSPEVPEVSLCFQNRLFRANRTIKYSAGRLNAFVSGNYPQLAEVGIDIEYNRHYIARPDAGVRFGIFTDLSRGVAVVRLFPGMGEATLRAMLSVPGVRGVVLETYGAGNAPTSRWFLDAVRACVDGGTVVVGVSQCGEGAVSMGTYETGRRLSDAGVVGGRDMTTEACAAKLMYLLGRYPGSPECVARLVPQPLRGEISV